MSHPQSTLPSSSVATPDVLLPSVQHRQFRSVSVTGGGAKYRRGKKAVEFVLADAGIRTNGLFSRQMSRKQAIAKVKRCLQKQTVSPAMERKAKSIMSLFVLEAEELLEAGIAYEHVCALQRHWLI